MDIMTNNKSFSSVGNEKIQARELPMDEIDLLELWHVIWAGRYKIISISFVFAVLSVIYVLFLPNVYSSKVVLSYSETDSGGLGSLAKQYGGLASIAGIDIGGGDSSRIDQALAVLTSWPFLDAVIKKHQLKPQLTAVEGWDPMSNTLTYDTDKYDIDNMLWHMDDEVSLEPSSFKTYEAFSKIINKSLDSKTGLVTLSVDYYSPQIAKSWVDLLVNEINVYFQKKDIKDAERNLNYLNLKIKETNITQMQEVLYSMVEQQTQTLMLAEANEYYLLTPIVKSMVPEEKASPRRALIVLIMTFLGGVFSVIYVLITGKNK